jgi:hypothetical protein
MAAPDDISLREYVERLIAAERERVDTRLEATAEALRLQAAEYERRLATLNHAHEQAVEVQNTYVTQEKYEDKLAAEAEARETALQRIDEKFADYVRRYEQRQREVDEQLTIQRTTAETAATIAQDTAAKTNRNIAALGVLISALVVVMNVADVGV